ncbi:IQ motif containing GTPase activating protein 2 S homeolog [Xenopus laevis]|uniref:IQ motif containing GTPase activating protein 2 n=1 Tax=Xenopus laevis TaxID=8355 RepID=Q7ZT76_XENLA|nr:IQ motif containing GTPase activating protein 2 S homeolog [Xenopus laevis]BAC75408.1 IQ motif containing GTPase activating protein 2 [Xenopus laevis]
MNHEDVSPLLRPRYGSIVDDERLSAEEMDERRRQNIAYEYLCHLEEAKRWMEACLVEELPPTTELEEGLRNGVYLAKLGRFFAPKVISEKKIYDVDQTRLKLSALFPATTIPAGLRAMESIGLPKIFYPETTDVYDRKNIPRVIYCIHALSLYLFKLGIAPQIQDLLGKVDFTEEEISNMRKELEKYGIQMPSLIKLGGISSKMNSPWMRQQLHAAVIAIYEALDKGVASQTMVTLRNPNAMLLNVEEGLVEEYQRVLEQAKKIKEDNAKIKNSTISEEERDVYEELLTQAEIQGHITKVNTNVALVQVNEAIDRKEEVALLNGLMLPILSLFEVQPKNSPWYLAQLCNTKEQKTQKSGVPSTLDKNEIQKDVSVANKEAEAHVLMLEAVEKINAALLTGDSSQTLAALQLPEAQMPAVHPFAETLYHMELQNLQKQNPANYLTQEELFIAIEMLSAVALVNQALETNDMNAVQTHLASHAIGLNNLEEDNMQRYTGTLASFRREALHQGQSYLGWTEIQKCIDGVNDEIQEENERITAIGVINDAIAQGDPESTLAALLSPPAKLLEVSQENACHYQDLLQQAMAQKSKESEDESAALWLDEIQKGIHDANLDREDAQKLASGVAEVNLALEKDDAQQTLMALQSPKTGLKGVLSECSEVYHKDLCEDKKQKTTEDVDESLWLKIKVKDKYDYYYNVETEEGCWTQPEGITPKHSWLTREEIQYVVGKITADYNREQLWMANENLVILLQAQIRGFLLRKAFSERKAYLHKQEPSAIKLQACWKGYKQRKSYTERLKLLQGNIVGIVKIQSWFRMLKARKGFQKRLQYFTEHEKEIIKIQAFLRANKAREDYRTLISSEEPPLNVVRKFVYLLDQSDLDFHEELEVTRLREEVVTKIRSNQQLEKDLNLMDIKIGLLVKNRITLQDVVSHSKKLNKKSKGQVEEMLTVDKQGIKCLSKDKRKKLEAYQHLFYLLQTNPTYLAKLIFQMPQNKSTKFMDTVIFTLYNYASNQREEYLLLKLFETALQEEIKSKVDQIQDIVTGNPTVIKMVVSFNRGARGQNTLRQLLAPVVKEIIEDKSLIINTSPVEVYKAWVNQLEMATGEASKLPYDVTTEQALSHPEVVSKLESSIQSLRVVTDKVLQSIFSSLDLIPYGMRYTAKVLKNSLHEKFPDATEDELLKIVGNLLYYRYMNPAIVAPDGFDIIDMTAGGQIHSDQTRNLGSVAKVLQHAASNKLFDGENAHMSSINSYLSQTYQKFRKFFQSACEVPEPEEKFNIDEFSDLVTLSKPVIYISIEEIINTHSLLLEHQDAISPDHNDILHELLEALGTVPDVESFLGEGAVDSNDPNKENTLGQMAKTEISLSLTSKLGLREGEDKDMKSLMIKTKKLIVDVIRTQSGETITEILETQASVPQENEHLVVIERRSRIDAKTPDKMKRSHSVFEDGQLPLEQKKRKILRNLRTLEQAGLVTEESKYQEIIIEIAKDIRNQRRYRQRRKAELVKLQQTLNALNSKTAFYQEQINYYNTYIKTCLDNLTRKNSRRSIKVDGKAEEKGSKKTKQATLKYTAARLHEKGVILEIEGLQTNQFKNVLFDITPGYEVGDFEVKAKFFGVEMEKVQLHFQDLLQMQYDGVAVMKMFDKAKVNVNLLIFLLNRKFYGK